MIDRKIFFDHIRMKPFGGSLRNGQVDGPMYILDEWERRGLTDLRWLAYMLATTYHETDHTMQPIYEKGERSYFNKYEAGTSLGAVLGNTKSGDGYLFRGRGFVQLTGRANYEKMHTILGVALTTNPDLALDPKNAAAIMFEGMSRGTFTGKKLTDYFNSKITDWKNARRIINGTDRAGDIADYAQDFYQALVAAKSGIPAPVNMPVPVKPVPPKPPAPSFWASIIALFKRK